MSAPRAALLHDVVRIVQGELARPQYVWQLVVVAIAVAAGWVIARWVQARVDARVRAESREPHRVDLRQFSIDGFRRLAFPVAAAMLVLAGGLAMHASGLVTRSRDLPLLRLALTLLAAMAVIRLFVYVLRRSFSRSSWLSNFERGIVLLIWLLVALHVTGLLTDLVGLLDRVRIPIGKSQVTLWDLLAGAVLVVLTLLAAMWIGSVIEARLMAATSLNANSRVVLSRVAKALLAFVAVLTALSLVGIDITVLSVFGGALGVGLGLGLQRIASNYVSGFIILLDHSLTIGDMITVDKYRGAVSQINTRYTVLRALDGTEFIVPNEMLVSAPVINHSTTERKARVAVRITVGHAADLERSLQIMVDAARAERRVLSEPAPVAFVTGLVADGVELELGFWVADPDDAAMPVRSAVARLLLQRLGEAGIVLWPARGLGLGENPAT
jgi:small-conductance mechanosensitive channel